MDLGHVAFFSFISELHTPTTYPKALFLLQGVDVSMYVIVAIVTYRYAGTDVASPALGSTSPLLRKIAYGIAIPTIVIAGMDIPKPVLPIPNDSSSSTTCLASRRLLKSRPNCLLDQAFTLDEGMLTPK